MKTPKKPMRKGVSPPRAPVQKDSQIADGIKSTATSKATISHRNSKMGPSVKIEDDDEPKPPIREPVSSKKPAPGAVDGPPAAVKRKREETPEKKPKKVKAEEELEEEPEKKLACCIYCEEEFDPEDEDDDGYCRNYHPGDMELNRYSHSWRVEACIDLWETGSGSEYDLDTDEWRFLCPGGFTWDCCGKSGGSRLMGCERRYHEAEESDEDDE